MLSGLGMGWMSVWTVLAQQQAADGTPAPVGAEKFRNELHQFKAETVDIAAWAGRFVTEWGLRLVGVLLVLMGAWIASAWVRRTLYNTLNRPHFDQTLIRFLSNVARWAVLAAGLIASLTIFGIAPTSLAAVVGAAGLAVGLALQGSLSNLAAGIMLLLLRPFKIGDTIAVAGQVGKVDDIELFHTKLDSGDNRRIIVPNGQIFGSTIENLSHHAARSVTVNVAVCSDADVGRTREVLNAAAARAAGKVDIPAPGVALANIGAASMEWQVTVWARFDDLGAVRQALVQEVKEGLDRADIGLPLPQMEVWNRGEAPPRAESAGLGGGGGGRGGAGAPTGDGRLTR